jgi:hypothetical protein
LLVDVEFTRDVLCPFVSFVGHRSLAKQANNPG